MTPNKGLRFLIILILLVTFALLNAGAFDTLSASLSSAWFTVAQSQPASANADAENVEFVGQIGGATYAVAVQGNYAYIGVGPRLIILDVSNPFSPVVVGKTLPLPGIVQDVYVAGNYAYVADDYQGLRVIDVSNPVSPNEIDFYVTPGTAQQVTVIENDAYVADSWGGLAILRFTGGGTPTPSPVFLPLLTHNFISYFNGPWEKEPNNTASQSNGPLRSGTDYFGYPNDTNEYFSFFLDTPGQITVDLSNHTGQGVQLMLYDQPTGSNAVVRAWEPPCQLVYSGGAGWYYVRIYMVSGFNSDTGYTLRVGVL
ncbi:MAG: LVIVD repeat-containing protein [Anaerolineales bacterium]